MMEKTPQSHSTKSVSKNALVFILVTTLIDSIGFGLIIPVMPALLKQLLDLPADSAAIWGGYLAFVYAAMTFLFGPTVGNISDRFGRRPVLLVSLAALVVDYLIMGFAHSIMVLFVGRLLSGIAGATISTAYAYVADVTPAEKRGQAFGMVGAAFGIGFILGPALGGLLGGISPRAPFFAAAAMALINMVYGWLILPESLASQDRRPFNAARANPFGAFAHFSKLPNVAWYFGSMLFFSFAHVVYPSTWNFHADARYGWGSQQIGWSLMCFGVGSAVVQGGLIGVILKRLGAFWTATLGLLLNVVAFVGFAFASQVWMVYAWLPVAALGAISGPAINALMSANIPRDAQGELQGAMSSVHGIANMLSPLVMTQVFAYFLSEQTPIRFHGAAFLLAALLTVLSLLPFGLGARMSAAGADAAPP